MSTPIESPKGTPAAMEQRILIVDDCDINVEVLEEILCGHYDLDAAYSGREALDLFERRPTDLVLLDIMMPGIDGYEICRRIKAGPRGALTPVILVSGKASTAERLAGYRAGADDFLVKPFDHDELLAKVAVHLKLRETTAALSAANARIQRFNSELEALVQERAAEVVATRDVAVFALAKLADSRDTETGEHLERIRAYCQILAERLQCHGPYGEQIDQRFLEDLYRSSPLHDIGKVGIPDAILLKPGPLTEEEFAVMKRHSEIGAQALSESARQGPCGGFLAMAVEIARHHHERFDGRGYPDGLAGTAIPLASRIVALADVFDALTSQRVYKDALDPHEAKAMIEAEAGFQFDPVLVDAFRACFAELVAAGEAIRRRRHDSVAGASSARPLALAGAAH